MNHIKKVLTVLLSALLLFSSVPAASASACPFTDVKAGAYYYDAVMWAVNHKPEITTGTSPDKFSPNLTCTRAQVVTFLWRSFGSPTPKTSKNPFTDVKSSAYYYNAVLWASENKITSGTSADKFSPNDPCTRGQVVTFLHRASGSPEVTIHENPFTDVKASSYCYKAVLWAAKNSITNGVTPTSFQPNVTCTRAQVVTFLYRANLKQSGDPTLAGTYSISFWGSQETLSTLNTQIQNFNNTNTSQIRINPSFTAVNIEEMADQIQAASSAKRPDLFVFPQDQFSRLINVGMLSEVPEAYAKQVTSSNDDSLISAAAKSGNLYAYPVSADNGYFLYYDKRIVTHPGTMEGIISDCKKAGKTIAFELSSGWYLASYFFGAGCSSEWTTDVNGKFTGVTDNFNSSSGLIAARGMKQLMDSGVFSNSSSGDAFSNGAGAFVSGVWNYTACQQLLGSNLGTAALPSFSVDGKSRHLGSFMGCKMIGVKPQSNQKREQALHLLTLYLAGENCQIERYDALNWGPSNTEAQALDRIKKNPALSALLAQTAYSVPQKQIPGEWWDITNQLYNNIRSASGTSALQTALKNYETAINKLVK